MNARAVVPGGERLLAEVPRLQLLEEVLSTDASPPHEVLGGDEDPAVVARPAARAAGQAVEIVRHVPWSRGLHPGRR